MRYFAAGFVLTCLCLSLACSPALRYSGKVSKQAPPEQEEEKSTSPVQPPPETLSRIDKTRMNRIIAEYMSAPYQYGGTGKSGLDCSGFAYVVYRDYDNSRLPLTVRTLYRLDNRVEYNDLTFGDLVFFKIDKRKVSHVGIYLGEGNFVHASRSHGVVIDDLTADYWAERYGGARRVKD